MTPLQCRKDISTYARTIALALPYENQKEILKLSNFRKSITLATVNPKHLSSYNEVPIPLFQLQSNFSD